MNLIQLCNSTWKSCVANSTWSGKLKGRQTAFFSPSSLPFFPCPFSSLFLVVVANNYFPVPKISVRFDYVLKATSWHD